MAFRQSPFQTPKQHAEAPGQDSFLDVVANLVGILIILIIVVGVATKKAMVDHGTSAALAAIASEETPADLRETLAAVVAVETDINQTAEKMQRQQLEINFRRLERDLDGEPATGARVLLETVPIPQPHRVRIEVMGPARLLIDGEDTKDGNWRRQRVRQLVAALVAYREIRRDRLGVLLWPDFDDRALSANLRFAAPRSWRRALALGAAAGLAMWAPEFFVTQELLVALTGVYPDLPEFDELVGNLPLLLVLLAANFVFAALGEELVWRGFALPRVAELLGGSRAAWAAALVLVNAGFRLAHLCQGATGVVEATLAGVLLGALYLASGRNLVAPMAAHFVSNTIDLTVIYLGRYPGVGAG